MAILHPAGTILLAQDVPDMNGTNPKDRPVLLLADLLDTEPEGIGAAISSTFGYPLLPTQVLLPHQRQGRCQTGLSSPSVAVCDWPVVVGKLDILARLGTCPTSLLVTVLAQLPLLQPKPAFRYTPNATRPSGS